MSSKQNLSRLLSEMQLAVSQQNADWNAVLEAAKTYAQFAVSGTYLEKGVIVRVHPRDTKDMVEVFKRRLLQAAENAFVGDALTGKQLHDTLRMMNDE